MLNELYEICAKRIVLMWDQMMIADCAQACADVASALRLQEKTLVFHVQSEFITLKQKKYAVMRRDGWIDSYWDNKEIATKHRDAGYQLLQWIDGKYKAMD